MGLQIEYYVAPYEADAQLAYLYMSGIAQLVITEDSDLLAFGVKRVLFHLDKKNTGNNSRKTTKMNYLTVWCSL